MKTIVVANGYEQFKTWCEENDLPHVGFDVIWASSWARIAGFDESTIERIVHVGEGPYKVYNDRGAAHLLTKWMAALGERGQAAIELPVKAPRKPAALSDCKATQALRKKYADACALVDGWASYKQDDELGLTPRPEASGDGGHRYFVIPETTRAFKSVQSVLAQVDSRGELERLLMHIHYFGGSIHDFQLLSPTGKLQDEVRGLGFTKERIVHVAYADFLKRLSKRASQEAAA